jgi:alkyl hydroperoxide reductase subunit F
VYAARKLLKTILVTEAFGGQSLVSPEIHNWIGTAAISGEDLAKALEMHVRAYAGDTVHISKGERVTALTKKKDGFTLTTKSGKTFDAKTVLVTSGGERRKLGVPGAMEFEQKGLSYCASCDGPLFDGQDVAVVGGGNAGFETAAQLLAYCPTVTLLQKISEYTADPITVKKVLAHPKMRGILNAETVEVFGEKFVTGLAYKDTASNKTERLKVSGIFVEIGILPSTQFLDGLVGLDQYRRIVIDPKNQQTSAPGIWAAGDCTNVLYHQNNIAAGDAVRALEDIYLALATR